jgi:hypothetical protein
MDRILVGDESLNSSKSNDSGETVLFLLIKGEGSLKDSNAPDLVNFYVYEKMQELEKMLAQYLSSISNIKMSKDNKLVVKKASEIVKRDLFESKNYLSGENLGKDVSLIGSIQDEIML